MLTERVLPEFEVIRAIFLEDGPCSGVSHLAHVDDRDLSHLLRLDDLAPLLKGAQSRVD